MTSEPHQFHAVYVGTYPQHIGHTALMKRTAEPTVVKVQFDDLAHPFSHGWHCFPANEWKVVTDG